LVWRIADGTLVAMSRIVGIDLGTTNSLLAAVDAGIPYVIADAEGQRLTPSVVHFPGGDAVPVVGHAANRIRALHPRETVYSVKRFMGRRAAEIGREEMIVNYPVGGRGAGPVEILIHDGHYTPERVSAEVLKKLKGDAERALGEPVTRAVITVPAYFNDAQRNATKLAGELAGLTVERILNEPTAAALAYGLDRLKDRAKIAVYDLGGGTFDLSILELHEGVFQVLATHGDTRLGGDDLDKRVVQHLVQAITAAGGPDAAGDARLLARVREAAEQAKIKLSSETEVAVALPFLTPLFSFETKLTRAQLEELTRDLVIRTREHCVRALADAKLAASDLDQVILVGGQTRMPLVRRLVAEWFGCAEFAETRGDLRLGADHHTAKGPALNTSVNPDEAVALGAAIQAEILSGGFRNMLLLDVTPLSLGLETFGGLMNVILPRNSTIPVKPKGVPRVGVQFEIDANGILHVLARDLATGREMRVEMKSAVDVDDAAVQRMVEESVEHAFDDLAVRRWIEAKLRAEETLKATRGALNTLAAEIDPAYRAQLDAALGVVEAVLSAAPAEGAGDTNALKAAHAELDAVTQPLADALVARAMEAAMRRRQAGASTA
jgi:molecular chaperone DnaK